MTSQTKIMTDYDERERQRRKWMNFLRGGQSLQIHILCKKIKRQGQPALF